MDAELLLKAQDSGARVKAGGVVGLVDGFRTGSKGIIRLRDAHNQLVEVATTDFEVVDPIDEDRVAQAQAARDAENAAATAAAARAKRADLVAAVRDDPELLDQLAALVDERRATSGR